MREVRVAGIRYARGVQGEGYVADDGHPYRRDRSCGHPPLEPRLRLGVGRHQCVDCVGMVMGIWRQAIAMPAFLRITDWHRADVISAAPSGGGIQIPRADARRCESWLRAWAKATWVTPHEGHSENITQSQRKSMSRSSVSAPRLCLRGGWRLRRFLGIDSGFPVFSGLAAQFGGLTGVSGGSQQGRIGSGPGVAAHQEDFLG